MTTWLVVSFYGSCPFYYSLSVLEQSVELLSEVAFCDGTYVLVNELTTLEEEDCAGRGRIPYERCCQTPPPACRR